MLLLFKIKPFQLILNYAKTNLKTYLNFILIIIEIKNILIFKKDYLKIS